MLCPKCEQELPKGFKSCEACNTQFLYMPSTTQKPCLRNSQKRVLFNTRFYRGQKKGEPACTTFLVDCTEKSCLHRDCPHHHSQICADSN